MFECNNYMIGTIGLSIILLGCYMYSPSSFQETLSTLEQARISQTMLPRFNQLDNNFIGDGQTKYLQCHIACNSNLQLRKLSDAKYNLMNDCANQCNAVFLNQVPKVSW